MTPRNVILMSSRGLLVGAVLAALLSGCSRENELNCEPVDRYAGAASISPVRTPEDLTPPDETDSLRLPPPPAEPPRDSSVANSCLESPPAYFEDRSLGRGEAEPAEAEAPESASPAVEDDPERSISN